MDQKGRLQGLNDLHKALREALTGGDAELHALDLFLSLHSQLHSRQVSPQTPWSYEDWLLDGLEEAHLRAIPEGQEHSIAWVLWHLTRVEDVTMNLLVAGQDQVFELGNWQAKTASPIKHTGNGAGVDVALALSEVVDIHALRAYRAAVGLATQEIARRLTSEDFDRKVAPDNLKRIMEEEAVLPAGQDVVAYWSRRDVKGLLLMPPTRHAIVHWNEAARLKGMIT